MSTTTCGPSRQGRLTDDDVRWEHFTLAGVPAVPAVTSPPAAFSSDTMPQVRPITGSPYCSTMMRKRTRQ